MQLIACGVYWDVYQCEICGREITVDAEELDIPECNCDEVNVEGAD